MSKMTEQNQAQDQAEFLAFTPQLIVTLAHDGKLQVELPGAFAERRKIVLKDDEVASTLRRILSAQAEGLTPDEIGQDSAPTEAQVRHWERHGNFPDSRCRFCLAEGRRAKGSKRLQARIIINDGEIRVKFLPAGLGKAKVSISDKTSEELGL